MKHIIWSNIDLEAQLDDWKSEYLDYCKCKANLDKATDGRILVIAELGLWNGKRSAYKILARNNVNAIFGCVQGEKAEFYFDGHNVKCIDKHHDGTNYYEFREIREDKDISRLTDAIYGGKHTREMINRYTKSLAPYVKEVYGW